MRVLPLRMVAEALPCWLWTVSTRLGGSVAPGDLKYSTGYVGHDDLVCTGPPSSSGPEGAARQDGPPQASVPTRTRTTALDLPLIQ
jgi:hypothetical protein